MFTVRITTALIQPMGDKRYVDGTTALANGIGMLMQALASALVLFIITLAIMSGATNGIGSYAVWLDEKSDLLSIARNDCDAYGAVQSI